MFFARTLTPLRKPTREVFRRPREKKSDNECKAGSKQVCNGKSSTVRVAAGGTKGGACSSQRALRYREKRRAFLLIKQRCLPAPRTGRGSPWPSATQPTAIGTVLLLSQMRSSLLSRMFFSPKESTCVKKKKIEKKLIMPKRDERRGRETG